MGENNGKPGKGMRKKTKPHPTIGDELAVFLQNGDALVATLPLLMLLSIGHCGVTSENFRKYLETNGESIPDNPDSVSLKPEFHREANRLARAAKHAQIGDEILPRSFLVALVSEYDFFLGRLIRCLFRLRPEKINNSEKPLTFAQLLKFGSVEDAREYILEKEIETVLRMSHAEQFEWFEKKFGVDTLTKNLDIWPQFIEITERRNLFVHCRGVVSSQYRAVCAAHGVKEIAELNVQLDVDIDYFVAAYKCLSELAVKLAHVMWRVVAPTDREKADESMNGTLFELIGDGRYEMAIKLGHFTIDTLLRNTSTDKNHRMITLNLAQAYKWTGNHDEAKRITAKADWSATGDIYQLALAVLHDEFETAARVMRKMGKEGEVEEAGYQNWPIFKEFRKSETFLEAYQEIFGKEFVTVQRQPTILPERVRQIKAAITEYVSPNDEYVI